MMVTRKELAKYAVLFLLFVVPIIIYMFFASGVYHFSRLPTLTPSVEDVDRLSTLNNAKAVSFSGKITIFAILGNRLEMRKTNVLNINEKIYKRFYEFSDLQFVVLLPEGTQHKAATLLKELGSFSDTSKWYFLFASPKQIHAIYNSLKLPKDNTLTDDLATSSVFIIDKNKSLRGRKKDELLYGYNALSIAEISNKMIDDVKVILAEYRLELKKYGKRKTSIEI